MVVDQLCLMSLPIMRCGMEVWQRLLALMLEKEKPNLARNSLHSMSRHHEVKTKLGRKIDIDWQAFDARLPTKTDELSRAARRKLFARFDPNGNGILSLAEVDCGLTKVIQVGGLHECKPAINKAFQAARRLAPPAAAFSDDYID